MIGLSAELATRDGRGEPAGARVFAGVSTRGGRGGAGALDCGEDAAPCEAPSAEEMPGGAGVSAPASRDVPHIPQKRWLCGFSFPQRLQRTKSSAHLAYDILAIRCTPGDFVPVK
jgi:hypothetical protein